ncbi:MAG: Flp1 family type IVb pilin [Faecalibacterium sp.]
MTNFANKIYNKIFCEVQSFKKEELGAVDLVVIVVLIGIAVALAVVFKDAISTLLDELLGAISASASSAISV